MKDELIKYETAKLAKEKGLVDGLTSFGCYCIGYGNKIEPLPHQLLSETKRSSVKGQFHLALAPTQSLLQKWLREKYKLDIEVVVYTRPHYCVIIIDKHSSIHHIERDTPIETYEEHPLAFLSYEEALEEGLIQALKLIKDESK